MPMRKINREKGYYFLCPKGESRETLGVDYGKEEEEKVRCLSLRYILLLIT